MKERDLFEAIEPIDYPKDLWEGDTYINWEREVLEPRLKELGFVVHRWRTVQKLDEKQLVRGADVVKDGVSQTLVYS